MLRLISHHDLMRCFERMLRRAAVPFHSTQGYNPKPRLVFALSLALGVVGCEEVAELELDEEIPPEEIHERLARQAPAGLDILSVRRIDPRAGAQVRRVCYRLLLSSRQAGDLEPRRAALLAAPHCWVDRARPQPRRIDIRPYVRDLHVRGDALEMDFWVTPNGTARPEEVLKLLDLADLLDAGAVLHRTTLELHDEGCVSEAGGGKQELAAPAGSGPSAPPRDSSDDGRPSAQAGHAALSLPNTQPEGNT
jgi:radical SAM-linked protein